MAISKLAAISLTAAICLPLGALLRSDASADVADGVFAIPRTLPIEGHDHLARAQELMRRVEIELRASRREGEPLWSDRTGRAAGLASAIEKAARRLDRTATWVRDGMAQLGPFQQPALYPSLLPARYPQVRLP